MELDGLAVVIKAAGESVAREIKNAVASLAREIQGSKALHNLVTVDYKVVSNALTAMTREQSELYRNNTKTRQVLHVKFVNTGGPTTPVYLMPSFMQQIGLSAFPRLVKGLPVYSMETVDLVVDPGVIIYFTQIATHGPNGYLYFMTEPY